MDRRIENRMLPAQANADSQILLVEYNKGKKRKG